MLAKTAAAGSTSLLPEVLELTSSLTHDMAFVREDLLGSLAHLVMLSRTKLIPQDAAASLKAGLLRLVEEHAAGTLLLPNEEDVHMAVEAELTKRIGASAGFLHTARSRNDQVALDLRLHVRESALLLAQDVRSLITELCARAEKEQGTLLPAYTHRQRAQPISAAYWLLGFASSLERDLAALSFVIDQTNALPLGVGAIAGSSLPIDREITRKLLGFERLTLNGLDTVGDRDFAIDFSYAVARLCTHASRFATDVVDFSSREFGFIVLDGEIACGSSMMPQKKNPDVFELVRGKSGGAVGDLVSLLVTMKGLPGGYNRDQQEDRGPLLDSMQRAKTVVQLLRIALPRIQFDRERCLAALRSDATQATDLAEALVARGMPFRDAYKKVGALVRACQEHKLPLEQVTLSLAQSVDSAFDEAVLEVARVEGSVARKVSAGSTGPASIDAQLKALKHAVAQAEEGLRSVPRLSSLFETLKEASLS
ncbi:MAG: argininosuccinate lyase [Myxococcaceae bacterium]